MFRIKLWPILFCLLLSTGSYAYGQSCTYGENPSSNCLYPRVISGSVGTHVVLMDVHDASGKGSLYNGSSYVNVGNLVYFSVTPDVTGWMTVSTCHPNTLYDTVLDVVSGQEFCAGGTTHAGNDDTNSSECFVSCSGSNRASQVTFYAYAGTSYTIRVGSYNENSGSCPLCLGLIVSIGTTCGDPPRNFICQEARELPGTFGSHDVQIDLRDMPSFAESWSCSSNVGHTVWFKFTADIDGIATFTTCRTNTEYDTVIRALQGECGGLMYTVACNDDSSDSGCSNSCGTNRASKISFPVDRGEQYLLEVGSYNNNYGGCELCLGARLTIAECITPSDCDDGNPCTDDSCGAGTCEHSPVAYGTLCPDDGNECTNDICDSSGSCTHPNKRTGTPCGDLSDTACTDPDTCNGSGQCVPNDALYGTLCTDDGNECTNDICNGAGSCVHPNKPAGTSCGDPSNTSCTDPDTCNGSGQCLANNASYGSQCTNDGNECTNDICNGAGSCTHPNKPAGTSCGDPSDTACTDPDTCNGSGQCLANNAPAGTPCPDGLFCNGAETCNGAGACQSGSPPCHGTDEICNESGDRCDYILSGYVYSGTVGDKSSPLADVHVDLYCSDNPDQPGSVMAGTTTTADGRYEFLVSVGCHFYNLLETDPVDYRSAGANSSDGTVVNFNWIQYADPLAGKTLRENNFWDLFDPPPGNWAHFSPVDCVTSQEVTSTVQVQDSGSGLDISSSEYAYSTDGGSSWSDWEPAACSGNDGTTDPQTITAAVAFGQDSGPSNLNRIKFRIADLGGSIGVSGAYSVHIDTTPPQITAGPTISDVTPNSVRISWQTNEDVDSLVRYGRGATGYDAEETDPTLVTSHAMVLTGLAPSATYRFQVQSTDACGNTIQGRDLTFETQPLPDDVDPTLVIPDPGVLEGVVPIPVNASDNTDVEKVEFYIDDVLVFTAFSPPYKFLIDTRQYANGQYNLKVKVSDLARRTTTDERMIDIRNFADIGTPNVHIYYPSDGSTVAGQVHVGVTAQDDSGWSEVEWFVDGNKLGGGKFPIAQSQPLDIRFWWDTRFLENKEHRLAVKATDDSGKSGLDYVDVDVSNTSSPSKPDLVIEKHELFRHGHTFAVELTVKNQGTATAHNIKISDFMKGFQPISRGNFNGSDYTAEFDDSKMEGKCIIDSAHLDPGSSRTYSFAIIPVMIHPNPPNPSLGSKIKLSYEAHIPYTVTYQKEKQFYVSKTTWTPGAATAAPIATAYNDALKESDYLIVTNPVLLFFHNPFQQNEVNKLLSDMAQLAFNKKGALGYLTTSNRNTLRNLIQPNGAWAQKLHPDFRATAKGYLLLVGEVEIIPAWNSGLVWNITWSNSTCVTREVRNSDLPYANTGGNNDAPELIVGRIIGNTAADLVRAIQTSNCVYAHCQGYGFDRSDALLVSGIDGDTDIQKAFTKFVDDVEKSINTEFSVKKLHWKDITATQRVPQFRSNTSDKDVITYMGHGSPDGWQPLGTAEVTGNPSATPPVPGIDFGDTNPLVLAWACLTGSYEDHTANSPCSYDGGDDNIAEAFFDRGAAVYIGATEVSEIGRNATAGKGFLNTYWKPQTTAGKALTDIKRNNWSQSDAYWQLWVWEYNLYGDPKFGAAPAGSPSVVSVTELESPGGPPPSSVDVEVPDYEVEIANGYHYVDIPNGTLLLKNGKYRIPYYVKSFDYPIGVRVQDVIMTYRSDPIPESGFNLPIHLNALAEPDEESGAQPGNGEGWYPEKDYDWKVIVNPNGTSTLIISMYPFKYNGTTKDVLFYKNYSFEINDIPSPVRITGLGTDQNEYVQGETITIHAGITNEGAQQSVIFSAVVKRCGSEDVVDSLLLHTLEQFTGEASFCAAWNSDSFDPGCYSVQTTLKDTVGNVLDVSTTMFNLGISSGEITQFTASPDYFSPGDHINITMQFRNTGTVDLSGTAFVRIVGENGENVHEFKHEISNMPPGNSTQFDDVWETAGMEEGTYHVLGYLVYNSEASVPVSVVVSTLPPCPGNFDRDSDVDGSDLAELATHLDTVALNDFAGVFGRSDCPH